MSLDPARRFVREMADGNPDTTPGEWFQFAIEELEAGEHIGDLASHIHGDDARIAAIGITLHRESQGTGYATQALRLLLDYLLVHRRKLRIIGGRSEERRGRPTARTRGHAPRGPPPSQLLGQIGMDRRVRLRDPHPRVAQVRSMSLNGRGSAGEQKSIRVPSRRPDPDCPQLRRRLEDRRRPPTARVTAPASSSHVGCSTALTESVKEWLGQSATLDRADTCCSSATSSWS